MTLSRQDELANKKAKYIGLGLMYVWFCGAGYWAKSGVPEFVAFLGVALLSLSCFSIAMLESDREERIRSLNQQLDAHLSMCEGMSVYDYVVKLRTENRDLSTKVFVLEKKLERQAQRVSGN